jgi:hypothetical protein
MQGNNRRQSVLSSSLALALALSGATAMAAAPDASQIQIPEPNSRIVTSTAQLELLEAHLTEEGLISEPVDLISTSFRVTPNRDRALMIRLDGECSAWLNRADEEEIGINPLDENGEVQAAAVAVWVEVNGEPVPVANDGGIADDGSVVYCNAQSEIDLDALEDGELVSLHAHSRSTAGFTWVMQEAGQGDYEVVVRARLDVLVDDENGEPDPILLDEDELTAQVAAVFGKRILEVQTARVRIVPPREESEL